MRGVFPNLRQGATCDMAQTRDLAPPGKRPAFVECRLSVVQLVGEPAPLLGEIEQNSRVLGGIGRFGQSPRIALRAHDILSDRRA